MAGKLADSWHVDIAHDLDSYLADVARKAASSNDGGAVKLNFAEAALLLARSAIAYGRKVEHLLFLVQQAAMMGRERGEGGEEGGVQEEKEQEEGRGRQKVSGELSKEEFLDFLNISEAPTINLDEKNNDAVVKHSGWIKRTPSILLTVEEDLRESENSFVVGGDIASYKLFSCSLHPPSNALLLQLREGDSLDERLRPVKSRRGSIGMGDISPSPSLEEEPAESHKSRERMRRSSAKKGEESLRGDDFMEKRDDTCNNMDEGDFGGWGDDGGGEEGGEGEGAEIHGNMDGSNLGGTKFMETGEVGDTAAEVGTGEEGRERGEERGQDEGVEGGDPVGRKQLYDPYTPLDPYDSGNIQMHPFKKVNVRKMRRGSKIRSNFLLDPGSSLSGCTIADFNLLLKTRMKLEKANNREMKSKGRTKREEQSAFEPPVDVPRNEDDDCGPLDENNDQEDGGLDGLEDQIEMVNLGSPKLNNDEGLIFDTKMDDVFNVKNREENGEGKESWDQLNQNLTGDFQDGDDAVFNENPKILSKKEVTKRVKQWKAKVEPALEKQDAHPPFDIHEFGERVISRLRNSGGNKMREGERLPEGVIAMSPFSEVVEVLEKFEVSRMFSAMLQMVNNGDVSLFHERNFSGRSSICFTIEVPFQVCLLKP